MNSDEERKLFEKFGWEYNYVKREWVAPDGVTLSLDSLVMGTTSFGPAAESELRRIIVAHGKSNESR